MPIEGEIRKGHEIGYKMFRSLFIWHSCSNCGKARWIRLIGNKPINDLCRSCAQKVKDVSGEKHWNWKGGRCREKDGYITIWLSANDFFYPMADSKGYVPEHRLIMAKHLHRCLLPWEVVHHKNGIRDDNKLENLQLLPNSSYHIVDSQVKNYIRRLQNQIKRYEVALVPAMLKE